jgi:hypothetical protein
MPTGRASEVGKARAEASCLAAVLLADCQLRLKESVLSDDETGN